MKYEIRTSQFCALSKDPQWQHWLGDVAKDLLDDLLTHLRNSKSCKSNKEKMIYIYNELRKRGLGKELIKFLRAVFPTCIKAVAGSGSKTKKEDNIRELLEHPNRDINLNKHGIFSTYKPHLLTFPHKFIIQDDDPDNLISRVRRFIKTKISVDYIILDDTAYIEYLDPKFAEESSKIPANQREIYQYKAKNGLLNAKHTT